MRVLSMCAAFGAVVLLVGCSHPSASVNPEITAAAEGGHDPAAGASSATHAPTDANPSVNLRNTLNVHSAETCLVAAAAAGTLPDMAFATYLHPKSYEQTTDQFKHKDLGAAAKDEAAALVAQANPTGTQVISVDYPDAHPFNPYTHSEVVKTDGFPITAGMSGVSFLHDSYACWVRWTNANDIPGGIIAVGDEATARRISDAIDKGDARLRVLARVDGWTPLTENEPTQRDFHLAVGATIQELQIVTTTGEVLTQTAVVPIPHAKLRPGEVSF